MTHLYLQLLNHLHLDSALSGAAVVQGVLIVQVPEGEGKFSQSVCALLSQNDNQIQTNYGTGSTHLLQLEHLNLFYMSLMWNKGCSESIKSRVGDQRAEKVRKQQRSDNTRE